MNNNLKSNLIQNIKIFFLVLYATSVPWIKPLSAASAAIIFILSVLLLKDAVINYDRVWYFMSIAFFILSKIISDIVNTGGSHFFNMTVPKITMFAGVAICVLGYNERHLKYALLGFIMMVGVMSLSIIYQYFFMAMRRPPTFMNAVHAGYVLSYGFVVAFLILFYHRGKWRWTGVVSSVVIATALLMTETRGAILSVIVPFFFLSMRMSGWKMRALTLVSILTVCSIVWTSSIVQSRFEEARRDIMLYEQQHDVSTSIGSRIEMWRASWNIFLKSPLFGVGPTEWKTHFMAELRHEKDKEILGQYNQTHNVYLHQLSTTGILGFFAFIIMSTFPIFFILKSKLTNNMFADMVFMVNISFLVQGMTDSVVAMNRPFNCWLMLIGVGLSGILDCKKTHAGSRSQTVGDSSCCPITQCDPAHQERTRS